MSNGLHPGCVQEFGQAAGLAWNRAILEQEQMFDSAFGSGVYNLLDIRRTVAHSDLLVESPQGLKRRSDSYRPNQFQSLLVHFVLAEMAGQSVNSRFDARRISGQTMKLRHFVFDANDNQRRMSILQQGVYISIHLSIEMAKVVFSMFVIVHRSIDALRQPGATPWATERAPKKD